MHADDTLHLLIVMKIRIDCVCVCFCDHPEVRVFADAVSLPGSEVGSDAEEPQTEVSAGDEDERISL